MKELSIEEKAKLYDEALGKAKKELDTCGSQDCDAARQIFRFFPELKKSEDDKIRKELINFIKQEANSATLNANRLKFKSMLAWIEKQNSSEYEKGPEMKNNTLMKCLQNSNAQIGELIEENFNLREELEKRKEQEPVEQNPAWSEEDEEMFDAIIADIQFTQKAHTHEVNQVVYEREIDWLKSLKERMQ